MPELPEVETVARQLSSILIGKQIQDVIINDLKLGEPPELSFSGAKVLNVKRLGKQIVVDFRPPKKSKSCFHLIVHLRMTGRLHWAPYHAKDDMTRIPDMNYLNEPMVLSKEKPPRATIVFEEGNLDFMDVRRFGTFDFTEDLKKYLPTGVDPLTEDYTLNLLRTMLKRGKQPIKQFLLRQDRLVGLGNIYACEILFRTNIHPERTSHSLSYQESEKLYHEIPKVLLQAIEHCGTTFSDFQDADGEKGGFQNFLSVYQKENQPCRKCAHLIKRISQQGRSTFFCPFCQR